MTNADKVRQMTDEELWNWLDYLGIACMCGCYHDLARCKNYVKCRVCWMAWLAEDADGADKKTRAERIRAMSDEELMEWLCDVGACRVDHCVDNRCRECWKDWLAEDADEIKTEEEEGK